MLFGLLKMRDLLSGVRKIIDRCVVCCEEDKIPVCCSV